MKALLVHAAFAAVVLGALGALAACTHDAPPARPNVLLVTIDTLRPDHLGAYGSTRPTSPSLDRLAKEAIVFENATTPRAKTSPALASLFTGMYPHEHGVRDLLQPIAQGVPLLAESLHAAGYESAAIVGNFVLKNAHCGFARGFDRYIETLPERQGVPPNDAPQRTARSLTDAALAALDLAAPPARDLDGKMFEPSGAVFDGKRPWFLWLHYMDPHGAYAPPKEHRSSTSPAPRWVELEPAAAKSKARIAQYNVPPEARDGSGRFDANAVIDAYDGEIRYVDSELGRLLAALGARGDLHDTWVIVVADHGESLGEQDYWFEHGFNASEATCRVPLLVRPPDGMAARPTPGRRSGAISLADLAPTLREWLALPAGSNAGPGSRITGVSRAALLAQDDPTPFATFSEKLEGEELLGTIQIKAVRFGGFKLIRRWAHFADKERPETKLLRPLGDELYDLRVDPFETHDLAQAPPADAPLALLREKLLDFAAADKSLEELEAILTQRRAALQASDAGALRELKALGY